MSQNDNWFQVLPHSDKKACKIIDLPFSRSRKQLHKLLFKSVDCFMQLRNHNHKYHKINSIEHDYVIKQRILLKASN